MIAIESEYVTATVLLDGGILWEPRFRVVSGRWVMPLAKVPWADDADAPEGADLAYIRKLGGAFLGLPFGGRGIGCAIGGWPPQAGEKPLHGRCASTAWHIVEQRESSVTIGIDFPATDSIARVEQTIVCATDEARLDVSITIRARRAASVAAGYHPVLRLSNDAGALELMTDFARGYIWPLDSKGGLASPDATFGKLDSLPCKKGGTIDLGRLPIDEPGEELVLLARVNGPIVARYYDADYDLTIDWDRVVLPNCLVWYHDRAADAPPFNNRFRGVGLEPSASAFDFSAATSREPNPLTTAGEQTTIVLSPLSPTIVTCSFSVKDFP